MIAMVATWVIGVITYLLSPPDPPSSRCYNMTPASVKVPPSLDFACRPGECEDGQQKNPEHG